MSKYKAKIKWFINGLKVHGVLFFSKRYREWVWYKNRQINQRNKMKYGSSFLNNKREIKQEIFRRDGDKCILCKNKFSIANLTIDHVLKVEKGGTNDINNLRLLCVGCHRERHVKEYRDNSTMRAALHKAGLINTHD